MHATNKLMQQACKQTHMSHMCGKCVLHVEHMCGTQLDASNFTRGSTPKPVFLPSFYLLNNLDCLFVLNRKFRLSGWVLYYLWISLVCNRKSALVSNSEKGPRKSPFCFSPADMKVKEIPHWRQKIWQVHLCTDIHMLTWCRVSPTLIIKIKNQN